MNNKLNIKYFLELRVLNLKWNTLNYKSVYDNQYQSEILLFISHILNVLLLPTTINY